MPHYFCLFSIWTTRKMHDFQGYFSRTLSFNFQDFPGQKWFSRAFRWKKPKKHMKHFWCAILRKRGKETPCGIVTKFCMWVDIRDLITCATFGDDRLRGLGMAGVEFPVFPLTCVVALTTHSHGVWWTLSITVCKTLAIKLHYSDVIVVSSWYCFLLK